MMAYLQNTTLKGGNYKIAQFNQLGRRSLLSAIELYHRSPILVIKLNRISLAIKLLEPSDFGP